MKKTLRQKIEQAVMEIDTILGPDGTRVELLEVTPGGSVRLRMTGDCPTCGENVLRTLKAGIESMVREQAPEVGPITID